MRTVLLDCGDGEHRDGIIRQRPEIRPREILPMPDESHDVSPPLTGNEAIARFRCI
jgi:hypothetical protein